MEIIVNGCEHDYIFEFCDTLFLRNYAKSKGYLYSTQIGGCESLRDIVQSRLFGAEFLYCSYVESLFAYEKLISSLIAVYRDVNQQSENESFFPKLFLDISTLKSFLILPKILQFSNQNYPDLFIYPILNRRSLIKEQFNLISDNFEVESYSSHFNEMLEKLSSLDTVFGIFGGISHESIRLMANDRIKPQILRLGLFTIILDNDDFEKLIPLVTKYQLKETLLLDSIKMSLGLKHKKLSNRQHHLMNYLFQAELA